MWRERELEGSCIRGNREMVCLLRVGVFGIDIMDLKMLPGQPFLPNTYI